MCLFGGYWVRTMEFSRFGRNTRVQKVVTKDKMSGAKFVKTDAEICRKIFRFRKGCDLHKNYAQLR